MNLATIDIIPYTTAGLLLTATMALAGCGAVLRKDTLVDVPFPPGCPTHTMSLPAGQTLLTVSYQEPSTREDKVPLKDLDYTTIYLRTPKGTTQAIRVWTNDPNGGARVTIPDIPVPGQELELCLTATNWGGKESVPVPPTKPTP